jgi:polyisoprenoid-binding protein YceI
MKKVFVLMGLLVLSASIAFAGPKGAEQSTYKVDTKASKVNWHAKKVTGEHFGTLGIADGNVWVKNDAVTGANIQLDMTSIDVTDLTGEWKDKLVGHLKSDDFFSVDKHPQANFVIKSLKKSGSGHTVTGDLTIKGITHEISFPAEVKIIDETLTASGTAEVDRTLYDIRYGSGKFFEGLGDKVIYDTFEIKFELVASSSGELSMN